MDMDTRYFRLMPAFEHEFFENLSDAIAMSDTGVEGYKELTGVMLDFPFLNERIPFITGLNIRDAKEVIDSIFDMEGHVTRVLNTGAPYIIEHYMDAYKQLMQVIGYFTTDDHDDYSRQQIITFNRMHCFTSIQFLLREGKVFTIANMRSCNYKTNFMMDLYLVYRFARRLYNAIQEEIEECTKPNIHVIMNIGSLHTFD